MKNDLYVPHLSSKIQVFMFSRFKVIAFFTSAAKFVVFPGKKTGTSDAKRREVPIKSMISKVKSMLKHHHQLLFNIK